MSIRIVTTALALSLLCGTSAMAQHDDHHGGGGGGGGAPHGGGGAPHGGGGQPHGGGGQAHVSGGGGQAHFNAAGPAHATAGVQSHAQTFSSHATYTSHTRSAYGAQHYGAVGSARTPNAVTTQSYHHGSTFGHVAAGAAIGAVAVGAAQHGGDHHRYSEQAFPREIHAQQRYQYRGQWNQPNGYYYRHWGYGERLPYGWFTRSFWITDFGFYGLPAAPYDYAWVREGPDALLVNVYTGQVVEVEYDVFY